ncbi:MAG: AAA family ATPase, partial [Halobacteriovoraceae bacterium]|nr:AAA family ATPase [Halobacteriovoraceae bacterium]
KKGNEIEEEIEDKYVFIIDEINRGNISKIFGELITLLEKDKREGNGGFALKLPYSGEDFIIPENVYIIGTMNTADRSIAMMDIALRRRFIFEEFMPKVNLIKEYVEDIPLRAIIQGINDKIAVLHGRDYQIGHSYFMDRNLKTIDDLKQVWFYHIIPLLNEYFYEEWDKLMAIIGPFIERPRKVKGLDKLHLQSSNLYSFKSHDITNVEFIELMKKINAVDLPEGEELEEDAA